MGIGLASIINIYNPDRILIAGWVFGAEKNYLKGGSSYRDEIIRTAKSIIPSKIFDETDIEFYEDDIEPTFRGACAVALENILKTPTELILSLREQ